MGIQYTITLEAGDGAQWAWLIRDHYFKREMKKIEAEMLEEIRKHDQTYEIGAIRDGG